MAAMTRRTIDVSTAYTRRNIRAMLKYYPDVFQTDKAESRLNWALVRADLMRALRTCERSEQRIFVLIGVKQRTFEEAAKRMQIDEETAMQLWQSMQKQVIRTMCDTSVRESDKDRPAPPMASTYSNEGRFDCWPTHYYGTY